jgi:hypothetical protein
VCGVLVCGGGAVRGRASWDLEGVVTELRADDWVVAMVSMPVVVVVPAAAAAVVVVVVVAVAVVLVCAAGGVVVGVVCVVAVGGGRRRALASGFLGV